MTHLMRTGTPPAEILPHSLYYSQQYYTDIYPTKPADNHSQDIKNIEHMRKFPEI